MSIVIGILCNDSIIVAADSQTTCGNIKHTDTKKITPIIFRDGYSALVAQAGNADRANRAIEIMQELALEQKLTSKRIVADLAEQAILQVKQELKKEQCNCSMEELRDYIWKHEQDFKLLIAHYHNEKPCIYIADLFVGAANRQQRSLFAAIGTGAELASYLLKEHSSEKMSWSSAFAVALYVIEEVKKNDVYCSGKTHSHFIQKSNIQYEMHPGMMDSMSKELANFNEKSREQRNKKLTSMLDAVSDKWAEKRAKVTAIEKL